MREGFKKKHVKFRWIFGQSQAFDICHHLFKVNKLNGKILLREKKVKVQVMKKNQKKIMKKLQESHEKVVISC